MHAIERLAYGNRWRSRHPADKLALGGGLLALSLALPPWPAAIPVLLAAVGAALLGARLPPADYARVLAVPAGFVLAGAAALAVSVDPAGPGRLVRLSEVGLVTAGETVLRVMAATASLLLIALTTPMADLLALLRRAGLPAPIVDVMLLTYRFSTLAVDAAVSGRTAQAARLGYVGAARSVRSAGLLAANLLPRVLDRASRLQAGLAARGWQGDLRVLQQTRAPSLSFVGAAFALQAAILLAWWVPATFAASPW